MSQQPEQHPYGVGSDPYGTSSGQPVLPVPGHPARPVPRPSSSPGHGAPGGGSPYGSGRDAGGRYGAAPSPGQGPSGYGSPFADPAASYASSGQGYGAPRPAGDPGTLDRPWNGIGMVDAVRRAHVKAFRYDGRAGRGEYWWTSLATTLVSVVLYGVLLAVAIATTPAGERPSAGVAVVGVLIGLLVVAEGLVLLSAAVRRLHDVGRSGWYYLVGLIPFGGIAVLIWLASDSRPEGQRFDRQQGWR